MTRIALVTRIDLEVSVIAARALSSEVSHLYVAGADNQFSDVFLEDRADQRGTFEYVAHDATDATSWTRVFDHIKEHHGRLDVFVNATCSDASGDLFDLDLASFRLSTRLNLVAPWIGLKGAINLMASKGGVIVNLSTSRPDARRFISPLQNAEFEALKIMTAAATLDCANLNRAIRVNRLCYDPDQLSEKTMTKAVQILTDDTSSFMTGADLVLSGPSAPDRK